MCVGQGADRRLSDAWRRRCARRGWPRASRAARCRCSRTARPSWAIRWPPRWPAPRSTCCWPRTGRAEVKRIETGLREGLAPAAGLCRASRDVRVLGAIGVVQLDHEVDMAAATRAAVGEGVWLRPFRDLVYTMPPYVTGDDDVARICAAVCGARRARGLSQVPVNACVRRHRDGHGGRQDGDHRGASPRPRLRGRAGRWRCSSPRRPASGRGSRATPPRSARLAGPVTTARTRPLSPSRWRRPPPPGGPGCRRCAAAGSPRPPPKLAADARPGAGRGRGRAARPLRRRRASTLADAARLLGAPVLVVAAGRPGHAQRHRADGGGAAHARAGVPRRGRRQLARRAGPGVPLQSRGPAGGRWRAAAGRGPAGRRRRSLPRAFRKAAAPTGSAPELGGTWDAAGFTERMAAVRQACGGLPRRNGPVRRQGRPGAGPRGRRPVEPVGGDHRDARPTRRSARARAEPRRTGPRRPPSGVRPLLRAAERARGREGAVSPRSGSELLAGLSGRVIEVGAGNGLNFAHYPAAVIGGGGRRTRTAAAAAGRRRRRACGRCRWSGAGGGGGPAGQERGFDAAVLSLVLCSVRDVPRALAELRRVLRPGGSCASSSTGGPRRGAWRRRSVLLDRTVWPLLIGGCHTRPRPLGAIRRRASRWARSGGCGCRRAGRAAHVLRVLGTARAAGGTPGRCGGTRRAGARRTAAAAVERLPGRAGRPPLRRSPGAQLVGDGADARPPSLTSRARSRTCSGEVTTFSPLATR